MEETSMPLDINFRYSNKRFLDGIGITDDELKFLIVFYDSILEKSEMLDREFMLFNSEISHRLNILDGFKEMRESKKKVGVIE